LSDFNVVVRGGFDGADFGDGTGWAKVEGDVLRITGAKGRELTIPADRVGRIRFCHFPGTASTRASYETKIWPEGPGEPLLILAPPGRVGDYALAMREFAARVAARRGLHRVMRGPGIGTAIVNFMLSGCSIIAVAILLLVFAIYDRTWWVWLIAVAAVAVAGPLVAALLRNHWPRRVRSLDELARELPLTQR